MRTEPTPQARADADLRVEKDLRAQTELVIHPPSKELKKCMHEILWQIPLSNGPGPKKRKFKLGNGGRNLIPFTFKC